MIICADCPYLYDCEGNDDCPFLDDYEDYEDDEDDYQLSTQILHQEDLYMKLIVFNNKMGDIVRIGLYDENNKWIKWISKKLLDKYIDEVEEVENRII